MDRTSSAAAQNTAKVLSELLRAYGRLWRRRPLLRRCPLRGRQLLLQRKASPLLRSPWRRILVTRYVSEDFKARRFC